MQGQSTTPCSIPDCPKPRRARGWCVMHYRRWKLHGDPMVTSTPERVEGSPAERFWAKVNKDGPVPENRPDLGPCWIWTGAKVSEGYGSFRIGRDTVSAHLFLVGRPTEGLERDHLCRVRACIRPSHLELVPHLVNVQRGDAGKRMREQTHCIHGHPFDEKNTRVNPDGKRDCKTCNRIAYRRKSDEEGRPRLGEWKRNLTHCKHGHAFDEANTILRPEGGRKCRTCSNAAVRAYQARKKSS